jgi:hypothetical protein
MPFTIGMLLDYFALYNERMWPLHVLGYLLGLLVLVPLFRRGRDWNRAVTGMLAFLWLWIGLVFWREAAANMAMLYGPTILFAAQGVLFLVAAARDNVAYEPAGDARTITGLAFIAYALVGYPLVGLLVGHVYPQTALSPLFPCPATLLTLGALLLARRVSWHLTIIPISWALSGALWFYLGMVEDAGLVIAGVVGIVMLVGRARFAQHATSAVPQP